MPYESDKSQWPLLITYPIGEATDDDIEQYLEDQAQALARNAPHVVIMDASRGKAMGAAHRRRISQWVKDNAEALGTYRKGLAFVSASTVVRGILTATYWLFPPPYPYKVFSDPDRAKQWALAQLTTG